ncbi:MAG: hypothetical protein AAF791_00620, partial [Bacteroidota bacterium]
GGAGPGGCAEGRRLTPNARLGASTEDTEAGRRLTGHSNTSPPPRAATTQRATGADRRVQHHRRDRKQRVVPIA